MESVILENNPLETEAVGKLIKKYSIPTAMTLMVNYLYNIVDQIFVGRGVGVTGMAAVNVSAPLTIVAMSIAMLIGDGCAANISLCLGRKHQKEADKTISQSLTMLCSFGILIALTGFVFAPYLIKFLGATKTSYRSALVYLRISIWGLPFLLSSACLSAIIRADGSPKYTMKCMIVGAVINTILDPVFIFAFDMGVAGAAIATVIGEVTSGLLCYRYMLYLKTVRIHKEYLFPLSNTALKVIKLGTPSFINQIMTAAVQISFNNQMTRYGAFTPYGSDVALSVYGMMMKVYQIAHSMFVGVSGATQPINGFNFGAGHYNRVKKHI